jgi:TQXA domain-containing protein
MKEKAKSKMKLLCIVTLIMVGMFLAITTTTTHALERNAATIETPIATEVDSGAEEIVDIENVKEPTNVTEAESDTEVESITEVENVTEPESITKEESAAKTETVTEVATTEKETKATSSKRKSTSSVKNDDDNDEDEVQLLSTNSGKYVGFYEVDKKLEFNGHSTYGYRVMDYDDYVSAGSNSSKRMGTNSSIAYCYNHVRWWPLNTEYGRFNNYVLNGPTYEKKYATDNTAGSYLTNFILYTKTNGSTSKFGSLVDTEYSTPRYTDGATLKKWVTSVAVNGYPHDYSGYNTDSNGNAILGDDEFRVITQFAIWYFTDSTTTVNDQPLEDAMTTEELEVYNKLITHCLDDSILNEATFIDLYEEDAVRSKYGVTSTYSDNLYQNLLVAGKKGDADVLPKVEETTEEEPKTEPISLTINATKLLENGSDNNQKTFNFGLYQIGSTTSTSSNTSSETTKTQTTTDSTPYVGFYEASNILLWGPTDAYGNRHTGYAYDVLPYSSYISASSETVRKSTASVAYCFNMHRGFPLNTDSGYFNEKEYESDDGWNTQYGGSYKYYTLYNKTANATNEQFVASSDTTTFNYLDGKTLSQRVKSVALNGYPHNYSGFNTKLTNDEFRIITQYAIWYFTDNYKYSVSSPTTPVSAYMTADEKEVYEKLISTCLDDSILDQAHFIDLYQIDKVVDRYGTKSSYSVANYSGNPTTTYQNFLVVGQKGDAEEIKEVTTTTTTTETLIDTQSIKVGSSVQTITFKAIPYSDEQTVQYLVKEIIPENAEDGITYDDTQYTITVQVVKDKTTGQLTVKVNNKDCSDLVYDVDKQDNKASFINTCEKQTTETSTEKETTETPTTEEETTPEITEEETTPEITEEETTPEITEEETTPEITEEETTPEITEEETTPEITEEETTPEITEEETTPEITEEETTQAPTETTEEEPSFTPGGIYTDVLPSVAAAVIAMGIIGLAVVYRHRRR